MSSLDNYRTERNVYLALYSCAGAGGGLGPLVGEALSEHLPRAATQCGLLGIVENTDSHAVLGVFSDLWQMQISCYLLLKSHFAIIQEQPRWLTPAFLGTGILLSILHVGLGTFIGNSFAGSRIRQADAVVVTLWMLLQVVLIDAGFCRIRTVVLLSDKSSATETKLYPQYLRIGRVVLLLNITVLSVTVLVAYSFVLASSSGENASSISLRGLVRVVALYVTLWWTFHRPCSKLNTASAVSTRMSSGPSRASSASGRPSYQNATPARKISTNPAPSALASLVARESDPASTPSPSDSSPAPSDSSNSSSTPSNSSSTPCTEVDQSAPALPPVSGPALPSEHVIEIATQS